jgi:hypothetical protein
MKNSKYHGNVVFTRPGGERRAGVFKSGFMEGQGEVDYSNGDRRTGLFCGGCRECGLLTLPYGEQHSGNLVSIGSYSKVQ